MMKMPLQSAIFIFVTIRLPEVPDCKRASVRRSCLRFQQIVIGYC